LLLKKYGFDMWLILTREGARDPLAKEVSLGNVVARSAGIFYLDNDKLKKIAIAASYDIDPIVKSEIYDEVIPYKQEGIKKPLKDILQKLMPKKIAINTSRDLPVVDGLSHGMYKYLIEILGSENEKLLHSSEELFINFRGIKFPQEIEAIKEAAITTQKIMLNVLNNKFVIPEKTTEIDIANKLKEYSEREEMPVSFCLVDSGGCRIHGDPTDKKVEPGDVLSIDFGVRYLGYSSDIQRCAYILRKGETQLPPELKKIWETTLMANKLAIKIMKPGIKGVEVDKIARNHIIENGYPEYPHAAGHPIGLEVHDVGPMLGPDWPERYGSSVHHALEKDMVFAVEPMIYTSYNGNDIHFGLEEDVIIGDDNVIIIGTPQLEVIYI